MARRRRRKSRSGLTLVVLLATAVGAWYWLYRVDGQENVIDSPLVLAPQPTLSTNRPSRMEISRPQPEVTEKGGVTPAATPAMTTPQRTQALINAGKQALASKDLIAARTHFSEALSLGVGDEDEKFLRGELSRLGNDTIFSPRIIDGDPHVGRYIIKTGDTLGKIAGQFQVSDDLLATINGIRNKNLIRVGQALKVVHGPFHAVVNKKTFTLDLFVGSTFTRQYRIGLGEDGSTPTGEWQVGTKLKNPQYYPPRGGDIIAADDPANPLGERWIGLIGISGDAMGQRRYGVHGTIEQDSIGRNASLGCIRMYNKDVEQLYDCLVSKHSTVTVE